MESNIVMAQRLADYATNQGILHAGLAAKNARWWWVKPAFGPTQAESYHIAASQEYYKVARCATHGPHDELRACFAAKECLDRVTTLLAQAGWTPPADALQQLTSVERLD